MPRFVSVGECMIEMSGGEDRQYRLGYAGDTLNTAWYARAALPADWQVDYFTALGDDLYSGQMIGFFEANNIGTGTIRRIPGKRPGLYMIHQADGDRHFTYWRDSSAAKQLADDKPALENAVKAAELVYFSGITLAILAPGARERLLATIGDARKSGVKTAFDPNIRPILWEDKDTLKQALTSAAAVSTFVLPTHADEVPYFNDSNSLATANRYLSAGAEEVVVKNGAEDALIVTAEKSEIIPAVRTENVVDATGAGDSFGGAYLAARLQGDPIESAAQKAHRTASIVIGHKGALVAPSLLA